MSTIESTLWFGGIAVFAWSFIHPYISVIISVITGFIWSRLFVQVEIRDDKEPYRWVNNFVSKNPSIVLYSQKRDVEADHNLRTDSWGWNSTAKSDVDALLAMSKATLKFPPGNGTHILRWNGNYIMLTKEISISLAGDKRHQSVFNICARNDKVLDDFLNEAMRQSIYKDMDKTAIFLFDTMTQHWNRALTKHKRDFESVILDNNAAEQILTDAREFLDSSDWYHKMGVPYRRSYLLYGKPGCGKTSFITAIAGMLNLHICVFTLTKQMNDSMLTHSLRQAPQNSIVLLEDLDVAFPSRDEDDDKNALLSFSGITLSGLLNSIDGIAAQEGRIIMMTTNHIECLDPALLRPGRADVIAKFDLASKQQASSLFRRFYPNEEQLANDFSKELPDNTASMAMLQGLFMKNKNHPLGSIQGLPKVLIEAKNIEDERQTRIEETKKKKLEKNSQLINVLKEFANN